MLAHTVSFIYLAFAQRIGSTSPPVVAAAPIEPLGCNPGKDLLIKYFLDVPSPVSMRNIDLYRIEVNET